MNFCYNYLPIDSIFLELCISVFWFSLFCLWVVPEWSPNISIRSVSRAPSRVCAVIFSSIRRNLSVHKFPASLSLHLTKKRLFFSKENGHRKIGWGIFFLLEKLERLFHHFVVNDFCQVFRVNALDSRCKMRKSSAKLFELSSESDEKKCSKILCFRHGKFWCLDKNLFCPHRREDRVEKRQFFEFLWF